jgi:hypothetical protein
MLHIEHVQPFFGWPSSSAVTSHFTGVTQLLPLAAGN